MSSILTIFKKEFRGYLCTPYGWIILAFVLVMQGLDLSATLKIFQSGPQKEGFLYYMLHGPMFWFYFLFIFPLITMRSFAEEEKSGTLESLLTAPIRTGHVVFGKFLAAYAFYIFLWLPMLFYPLIADLANFYVFKTHHYTANMELIYRMCDIVGSYSIVLLVGAFFISIGILCSSLTNSQIISGITTIGALVFIFFLGWVPVIWGESFEASGLFHYVSISEHVERFAAGLIDSRPFVFYISMTVLILAITIRTVDYRRWTQ